MIDYTKLSGAEFQRAVGADPEKWAEAFVQHEISGGDRDVIADWFRDAMEAAVKAATSDVVRAAVADQDWDRQRTSAELLAESAELLAKFRRKLSD